MGEGAVKIEEAGFSKRVENLLSSGRYETLRDVSCSSSTELGIERAGWGPVSLAEVRRVLAEHGLSLRGEEDEAEVVLRLSLREALDLLQDMPRGTPSGRLKAAILETLGRR